MQVILLEKIDNLGGIGDLVKVKPGYARNFLIPKGKATVATPENIAKFEERRAELERRAAEELAAARARAKKLEGQAVRMKAQARGQAVRLDRHRRYRRGDLGARRRGFAQRGALAGRADPRRRRSRSRAAPAQRRERHGDDRGRVGGPGRGVSAIA